MYKLAKILHNSALLELTGTRHTIVVPFKHPIDGDFIQSLNKNELITMSVYIGKYLKDNNSWQKYHKYNLPSEKNSECFLYGFSVGSMVFIKNGAIVSLSPTDAIRNDSLISCLTHADCQRLGIAIGVTQKISNITFTKYTQPYLLI